MTDDELPKKDNRMLGVGLAAVAAALLLFAGFSKNWLHNPRLNKIGFGPMGCVNCCFDKPDCSMSNGEFVSTMREQGGSRAEKETSGAFAPMGWATFGLCLIGGLALLATAFLAFRKLRPELPISPASVALLAIMAAMITGCVFVATKPGQVGFVGVSLGFWAFGAGTVAGIAAAQMLAKAIRPVDPDLLDGAMNPEQY